MNTKRSKPQELTFAIPTDGTTPRVIVKDARTQQIVYDIRLGDRPEEVVIRSAERGFALAFEMDASNIVRIYPRPSGAPETSKGERR